MVPRLKWGGRIEGLTRAHVAEYGAAPPTAQREVCRERSSSVSTVVSATLSGTPVPAAAANRSRTSRGVRGRQTGPSQQPEWNVTPAFSSTANVRHPAVSRRFGTARSWPASINSAPQRGHRLAHVPRFLNEERQGKHT
ncbi:hypothetical protein GCM10010206_60300 [Streptomyces cinerochromogenes]|nr:hypothetical protein GCM10010206_60300 [Streptomyces cinerochromogenes]